MTPNQVLWLMCVAAIVVMGLVALFFGAAGGTRSLDDVYERRARLRADRAAAAGSQAGDDDRDDDRDDDVPRGPTTPVTPARPATAAAARPMAEAAA